MNADTPVFLLLTLSIQDSKTAPSELQGCCEFILYASTVFCRGHEFETFSLKKSKCRKQNWLCAPYKYQSNVSQTLFSRSIFNTD